MPMVDQSLIEKGRNSAGHAAKISRRSKKNLTELLTVFRTMTYAEKNLYRTEGTDGSRCPK